MPVCRRPASKPKVVTRSRSPHTQRVSTNPDVESFIIFTASRCDMIELLADDHVKIVKGPNHGSWKLGENDDYIVHCITAAFLMRFGDISMQKFDLRKHGS